MIQKLTQFHVYILLPLLIISVLLIDALYFMFLPQGAGYIYALVLALNIGLSVWLLLAVKRWITQPAKRLTQAVMAIMQGDYGQPLPTSHMREINELASAIDLMRNTVQQGQKSLQENVNKAKASNEAKSDFLANMSHELRTPMNGVLGMVEMLRDTPLDAEQAGFAEQIRTSAESLLVILNDILDFSKIEAGALELEHIPFPVAKTVEDVVAVLTPLAQEKGLDLRADIAADVPPALMGDPGRLRQVLMNLIGNGVKFTPAGSVTVGVNSRIVAGQTYLSIAVEDTGIGIAEDKIDSIFMKFSQADTSNTRKFGGTGLGLTITQKLVTLMGGEIKVTSVFGQGSVFGFELPCILASAADVAQLEAEQAPKVVDGLARLRPEETSILVVEDDPVNQEVARRMLYKLGLYNVDVANDGQDGVAMYMPEAHNFILMDCQMPGMNGFEATEAIREREADDYYGTGTRVPIVALTANAMIGDREKCLAAGMDEYLSKPIKLDKLQALLSRWIDFSGAEAAEVVADTGENYSPVDLSHLAMFTDGDAAQETELFNLFFDTAYGCLRQLDEHVASNEVEVWQAVAHRLKGSAANLGAHYLAEAARAAEENPAAEAETKAAFLADIQAQFTAVVNFAHQQYGIEPRG